MIKCKICKSKTKAWYRNLFDDRHGYPGKFNTRICTKCSFGQTDPQIPKSKIAKLYANYYPWGEIDITKIKRSDHKMVKRYVAWRKGLLNSSQQWVMPKSKVLDVGCGMGYSLIQLESIGCKAYGIDPDINAKKMAKKFSLNFKNGFIEDNLFPNDKFDYVISNQVLEHVNNPVKFVGLLKSKLNENGKIILSFPNPNSATRKLLGKKWLHWHIPYHLNFFSKDSISILANKNKLKIEKIKTYTPNMWTNLQIRRLSQNPKIGHRDIFWDGKATKSTGLTKNILTKIVNFLEEYNFINRFIDILGGGESYLVILSKL